MTPGIGEYGVEFGGNPKVNLAATFRLTTNSKKCKKF